MNCDRCKAAIDEGEEREYAEQILCEDCYMDALSPVRTCDPWAAHSAKSMEKFSGPGALTELQSQILQILKDSGGIEPSELLERFESKLTSQELQREFAALRHMEKARAEKRGDLVVWRVW